MQNANPGGIIITATTKDNATLRGRYLRLVRATGIYQERFSIIPYSYVLAITGTSRGDSRKVECLLRESLKTYASL